MRGRRGCAAAVAVVLVAACSGDGPDVAEPRTTTTVPVTAGPVAAIDLVVGDCIEGLVIGAAERARIESARVVGCDSVHELEVFATFVLDPTEFETTEIGSYPGQQRVVTAADEGCAERLDALGLDDSDFGVIAVWPTDRSWAQGDRGVSCAAFSADGMPFERRRVLTE